MMFVGSGCETAKPHLNPSPKSPKTVRSQAFHERAPSKPYKEKSMATVHGQSVPSGTSEPAKSNGAMGGAGSFGHSRLTSLAQLMCSGDLIYGTFGPAKSNGGWVGLEALVTAV